MPDDDDAITSKHSKMPNRVLLIADILFSRFAQRLFAGHACLMPAVNEEPEDAGNTDSAIEQSAYISAAIWCHDTKHGPRFRHNAADYSKESTALFRGAWPARKPHRTAEAALLPHDFGMMPIPQRGCARHACSGRATHARLRAQPENFNFAAMMASALSALLHDVVDTAKHYFAHGFLIISITVTGR